MKAEALCRALPGRAEGGGGLEAETRNWEPVRRDGRVGAAAEAPEAQPAGKPPGGRQVSVKGRVDPGGGR